MLTGFEHPEFSLIIGISSLSLEETSNDGTLYWNTLEHTPTPSYTILHRLTPCYTILHHATPSYTILHHATPSYTILHYPTPSNTILHQMKKQTTGVDFCPSYLSPPSPPLSTRSITLFPESLCALPLSPNLQPAVHPSLSSPSLSLSKGNIIENLAGTPKIESGQRKRARAEQRESIREKKRGGLRSEVGVSYTSAALLGETAARRLCHKELICD
ncbi:hypothetical protein PAMA_016972 [Pampus argenteus]